MPAKSLPRALDRLMGKRPKPGLARREAVKIIAKLQRHFPTLYPVRLRYSWTMDGDEWGETTVITSKGEKFLLIKLNARLSNQGMFMVLLHEYAHAMVWRPDHQENERGPHHDAEWGLAEAKLWSASSDGPDPLGPLRL